MVAIKVLQSISVRRVLGGRWVGLATCLAIFVFFAISVRSGALSWRHDLVYKQNKDKVEQVLEYQTDEQCTSDLIAVELCADAEEVAAELCADRGVDGAEMIADRGEVAAAWMEALGDEVIDPAEFKRSSAREKDADEFKPLGSEFEAGLFELEASAPEAAELELEEDAELAAEVAAETVAEIAIEGEVVTNGSSGLDSGRPKRCMRLGSGRLISSS